MTNLDWCVVRDPFPVETGDFWKLPGIDPSQVKTEVFLMPASLVAEKDGSFTNTHAHAPVARQSGRPAGGCPQRNLVFVPPGPPPEKLYKDSPLKRDKPIQHVQWELPIKQAKKKCRSLTCIRWPLKSVVIP